jgi:hypothetical protein
MHLKAYEILPDVFTFASHDGLTLKCAGSALILGYFCNYAKKLGISAISAYLRMQFSQRPSSWQV